MKASRLKEMQNHGINVPNFIVVEPDSNIEDIMGFSLKQKFAVRSTCSTEDNIDESHADEFETLLNVDRKDVFESVQTVASSYKNNTNKVIIQEMIDSDISGVMFSVNPLGILNESIIVAGYGTGDNIVDNRSATSEYTYNTDENKFYTIRELEDTPQLSIEILEELIKQCKIIKGIFNFEVDIEYAIKDNQIYILQARPITTIAKDVKKIILDNSNIVESYPGVSSPLTIEFVKDIYYLIFKNCIKRLTSDDAVVLAIEEDLRNNLVYTVNNHFYYVINTWYRVLSMLPFSNQIIKIWQNMLGVDNKRVEYNKLDIKLGVRIKILKNFIYYLINTPSEMNKLNKTFKDRYETYRKVLNETTSIRDLIDLYHTIEEDFLTNWDITLINDIYSFIFTNLSDKSKISDIKNLASKQQSKALTNLIKIAKINENIENTAEYKAYIDLYGDRCIGELKLETETFRTNPNKLLEYLKYTTPEPETVGEEHSKNKDRLGIFEKRAILGIKNREESRLNRSRLFGLARDIFLKIGKQLQSIGYIHSEKDIFYLIESDINGILENKLTKEETQRIVDINKQKCILYKKVQPPRRLELNGIRIEEIRYNTIKLGDRAGALSGDIVSTGNYAEDYLESEVVVIPSIEELKDIQSIANKIVVTHSTDPGWVFILKGCLGIITEQGSLLSHTAIISRELHKPALVNVKDATKILHTDDKIRFNCRFGTIEIIEKAKVR